MWRILFVSWSKMSYIETYHFNITIHLSVISSILWYSGLAMHMWRFCVDGQTKPIRSIITWYNRSIDVHERAGFVSSYVSQTSLIITSLSYTVNTTMLHNQRWRLQIHLHHHYMTEVIARRQAPGHFRNMPHCYPFLKGHLKYHQHIAWVSELIIIYHLK